MNEQLQIIITAQIDKFKQQVNNARQVIDKFTEGSEKGASEMDKAFQEAGNSISQGFKTAAGAAAKAVAAIGASLMGTSALTTEYRQNQAQLNAAFEQAGFTADSASQSYAELYRVIGDDDQAVESAANIAMLASSEQEAAKWAELASGVLGTFHDTLQPESFYEAANETLKLGEATGAFTQMLEQTGVMSVDEFNKKLAKCKTETEAQALMLSVSEKAMGAAGESYNEATKNIQEQREAQANLTKTLAQLGEAVSPLLTAFTSLANDALAKVTPYIQQLASEYGPVLKEVLGEMAKVTGELIGWVVDNWEILAAIAGVITGIATAIGIYNAVAAVKAAMAAMEVTTVWALVSAYAAQAAAMIVAIAPYLLIVAAIAAVIAIIVLCVKHWDKIKEAVANAMQAIGDFVKAGIDKVKGFFDKIVNFVKENWQGLLLFLVNPFAGAFKLIYDNCEGFRNVVDNACKAIKEFFSKLWTNIKNIFASVGNFFSTKFNEAVSGIKKVFSGIANFFSGIWNSIKSIFSNVGSAIGNAITNTVKSAINGVLSTATKIINGFISAINIAISVINAIPGVNISKLNKLSVPKLAEGGIVDSATLAVIGESGKEAVVPLENNTEWMDKLVERLGAKMNSGSTPIILQVDGKTFAQTSIDTINQLTRQTGKLGIALV